MANELYDKGKEWIGKDLIFAVPSEAIKEEKMSGLPSVAGVDLSSIHYPMMEDVKVVGGHLVELEIAWPAWTETGGTQAIPKPGDPVALNDDVIGTVTDVTVTYQNGPDPKIAVKVALDPLHDDKGGKLIESLTGLKMKGLATKAWKPAKDPDWEVVNYPKKNFADLVEKAASSNPLKLGEMASKIPEMTSKTIYSWAEELLSWAIDCFIDHLFHYDAGSKCFVMKGTQFSAKPAIISKEFMDQMADDTVKKAIKAPPGQTYKPSFFDDDPLVGFTTLSHMKGNYKPGDGLPKDNSIYSKYFGDGETILKGTSGKTIFKGTSKDKIPQQVAPSIDVSDLKGKKYADLTPEQKQKLKDALMSGIDPGVDFTDVETLVKIDSVVDVCPDCGQADCSIYLKWKKDNGPVVDSHSEMIIADDVAIPSVVVVAKDGLGEDVPGSFELVTPVGKEDGSTVKIKWNNEKVQTLLQAILDKKLTVEKMASTLKVDQGKIEYYMRERARKQGIKLPRKKKGLGTK